MNRHPTTSRNRREELMRVAEQASEWLVTLEDSPEGDHEELARWLLESPLHTQMFLRAAAIDRKGATLHPTVLTRLMDGLKAAQENRNVLPLHPESVAQARPVVEPAPASSRRGWFAAAAGVVLTLGALWIAQALRSPGYTTETGEQRSIVLADGSVMHLNTRSRVAVNYSGTTREIRLVEGEALFSVARDAVRPFRVLVDNTAVQALGTEFNVYKRPDQTVVAVLEGSIQVEDEADTAPMVLKAGESGVLKRGTRLARNDVADIARITAWRQRQLVFERASLEDIAVEFNRYNRKPRLRVDESLIGKNRYTAVFSTDDPGLLLQFLARDAGLLFVEQGDELLIQPRPAS